MPERSRPARTGSLPVWLTIETATEAKIERNPRLPENGDYRMGKILLRAFPPKTGKKAIHGDVT